MNKFAAYGCISCVNISLKDETALRNTKAYEELVEELHNYFISYDDIYIDIITGSYRNRKKLKKLLAEFSFNDTIFIARLEALGFSHEEIIQNYFDILERGIFILIPDKDKENGVHELATTDFAMRDYINPKSREEIIEKIYALELKTNAGRRTTSTQVFLEDFEKVYWAYENYFISLETAVANNLFYVSRRKFYQLCDDYEKSDRYLTRLVKEEEENSISEKPKRFGKVPEYFDELVQKTGTVPSELILVEACKSLDVPILNLIDFKRYYLKSRPDGHSIAIKCAFNFAREIDDLYFLPKNAERMQNGY